MAAGSLAGRWFHDADHSAADHAAAADDYVHLHRL
jgi:hypothetical protein